MYLDAGPYGRCMSRRFDRVVRSQGLLAVLWGHGRHGKHEIANDWLTHLVPATVSHCEPMSSHLMGPKW